MACLSIESLLTDAMKHFQSTEENIPINTYTYIVILKYFEDMQTLNYVWIDTQM